jgi:DNA-binding transcriptional MocR family regulator
MASGASAGMSSSKPLINFLRGWPATSLLPASLMQQASQRALSNPAVATPAMLYGPDPGYQPLRESLARWMTDFYRPRDPVGAERITITGGASQSLGCILQVFSDPHVTRNVWIVAPAYMLAFRIFDDAALTAKMRAIPEDDEGIDVAYLEQKLREDEEVRMRGPQEPVSNG